MLCFFVIFLQLALTQIQTNISSDPSKLALASKRLSHTRLREIIKDAISSIGLDPKQYSTHSLRSGVASFMANFQGNNPKLNRLLKLQSTWKSDTSKDM
jgi:hypothetical protein